MNSSLIKYILLFGGVFISAKNSFAQQVDSIVQDVDYIKNSHIWLGSNNTAGIQFIPVKKISTANIGLKKYNGGFKDYSASSDGYNFDANTESYFRISKNVVLHGLLSYNNFKGKKMQGSALINPDKHPLRFDENADTAFGSKKLERYQLAGSVSTQISNRFTLGGELNYQAADYAKLKDLRHVNRLFNLDASLSGIYKITNWFELGAAYNYTKRVENLKFEIHGNTDRQYGVFVNYGSFYGGREVFGQDGYTNDKRPLVNNIHQISLQTAIQVTPQLSLLNDFSISKRKGYFGKKGTTEIMFTEHYANKYNYSGIFQLKKSDNLHRVKFAGNYETLTNMVNVYRIERNTGGVSTVVYYGKNEALDQQIAEISFNYSAFLKLINNNPLWILSSIAIYKSRNQKASIFPYYRKQKFSNYFLMTNLKRNIIKDRHILGFELGISYGAGNGTKNNDGFYQQPSEDQFPPASRETYLNQEYEFLTKPRVTVEPAIQYSKLVNDNTAAYIKLGTRYTRAFDVSYLGRSYNNASLSIGCFF